MVLSIVWDSGKTPPVFSQLTPRCSKSQVESRSLFLPHPTARMWLSIPTKCRNIFRQRLPVIRPAQMGYRRRICLKRQKRTLTVRAKRRRSVPSPNPHRPSIPAGRWGARAASVPLSFRAALGLLKQHKTMSTSWWASRFDSWFIFISRNTPKTCIVKLPQLDLNCTEH